MHVRVPVEGSFGVVGSVRVADELPDELVLGKPGETAQKRVANARLHTSRVHHRAKRQQHDARTCTGVNGCGLLQTLVEKNSSRGTTLQIPIEGQHASSNLSECLKTLHEQLRLLVASMPA